MQRRSFLLTPAAVPFMVRSTSWKSELPFWMKTAGVPSVVVGCIRRFQPAWTHTVNAKPSTLFQAASLTKQVTAHVALTLTERGQLDLDRPLVSWVDDLRDPVARTVTPRHVLSHSSGFRNWRFVEAKQPPPDLVPAFKPGSRYTYSGEGYVYLQRVIEAVTGKAFGQAVQEIVFDPMHMQASTLVWDPATLDTTALPHDRMGEPRKDWDKGARSIREWAKAHDKTVQTLRYEDSAKAAVEAGSPPLPNWMLPNGAASMVTTAEDYSRFLCSALRRSAIAAQQVKINDSLGWGLGWAVERLDASTFVWQWGDNGGYKNFVLGEPATGNALFVFTNGDGGARVYDRIITHATGREHPALLWL